MAQGEQGTKGMAERADAPGDPDDDGEEDACETGTPSVETGLLGGRMRLTQPAGGYRVAIDPLFLAASCPARPRDRVLDVGCGVGAAALALALRVPGVDVEGI